jgi:hypothetical protein
MHEASRKPNEESAARADTGMMTGVSAPSAERDQQRYERDKSNRAVAVSRKREGEEQTRRQRRNGGGREPEASG